MKKILFGAIAFTLFIIMAACDGLGALIPTREGDSLRQLLASITGYTEEVDTLNSENGQGSPPTEEDMNEMVDLYTYMLYKLDKIKAMEDDAGDENPALTEAREKAEEEVERVAAILEEAGVSVRELVAVPPPGEEGEGYFGEGEGYFGEGEEYLGEGEEYLGEGEEYLGEDSTQDQDSEHESEDEN